MEGGDGGDGGEWRERMEGDKGMRWRGMEGDGGGWREEMQGNGGSMSRADQIARREEEEGMVACFYVLLCNCALST